MQLGAPLRFRGAALGVDGRTIDSVRILRDGVLVAETAVDQACPELAFLPFPRAGTCRFDVTIPPGSGAFELRAVYGDGEEEPLFRYARAHRPHIEPCIAALPRPSPELIAATQGGANVQSYADSMISAVETLEALLGASGIDARRIHSVLDIGCGTGRALMGWHCDDPSRRIKGVDINAGLIRWSRDHLPGEWEVCDVLPPLPDGDAEFDLIQLISVFTHLPLEHQRLWVEELRRLLRPGGALFITLHGAIYARVFGQTGEYSEVPRGAVGSNDYATFHGRAFAERLFSGFELAGYFERGHDADPPAVFPVGSLQDVYVFRKL